MRLKNSHFRLVHNTSREIGDGLFHGGEGNGNPLQYSCLENPRDGKPAGLPSMGSHRVGHN